MNTTTSTDAPSLPYRRLARAQSAFYVATGVWPLVSRRTFEAVTGPKVDFWLVRTVGGLVAVIGGVLGAASREPPSRAIAALGAGSALALAAVDLVYATRGRISRVYLADAVVELGIVAAWALTWRNERRAVCATRERSDTVAH